jgi:hypothetical protein
MSSKKIHQKPLEPLSPYPETSTGSHDPPISLELLAEQFDCKFIPNSINHREKEEKTIN